MAVSTVLLIGMRALADFYAVPLLALCVAHLTGRRFDGAVWIIAWAIFVSFVANVVGFYYRDLTWQMTHYYPALQISLVVVALSSRRAFQVWAVSYVVMLAALSVSQIQPDSPEVVVRVGAATVVCLLADQNLSVGKIQTALLIYFGVGPAFQFLYLFIPATAPEFFLPWFGYQSCAMLAMGFYLFRIVQEPIREGRRDLCLV